MMNVLINQHFELDTVVNQIQNMTENKLKLLRQKSDLIYSVVIKYQQGQRLKDIINLEENVNTLGYKLIHITQTHIQ